MPEFCTCGTRLVEGAMFCHRCGRPTAEPAAIEDTPAEPVSQPITSPESPRLKAAALPVSFSNPVALRVALLMSVVIIPIELTPFLNMLTFLWWVGAGWCAVILYRRLTGSVLTVRAGARLGSITGVLTFLGYAIGITVTVLFAGKQLFDQMEKQNPDLKQVVNDPPMLFAALVMALAFLFAVVVALCAAGGALGARYAARKMNRSAS
ncbi:MAG TPA: zinc ribbon domain-containing protein [Bryobacteraceae bacterium]|nr:zinc ribbon domain-containing protein [Bryobacteraceae bacterium]